MTQSTQVPQSCKNANFNYCKWAKLVIAIPVIPIVALLAASHFDTKLSQMIGGGVATGLMVYAACMLDRIPLLQKKIVKHPQA